MASPFVGLLAAVGFIAAVAGPLVLEYFVLHRIMLGRWPEQPRALPAWFPWPK